MQHIYLKQKVPPTPQFSRRPPAPCPNSNQPSSKIIFLALLAIFLIIFFFLYKNQQEKKQLLSQQQPESQPNEQNSDIIKVPLISPQDLAQIPVKKQEHQLIDMRNPASFAQKHIEGSINFPLTPETLSAATTILEKNKKIIFIDNVNNSPTGKKLVNDLLKQGYQIQYLDGGIENYLLQNLPLISYGDPNSLEDKSKTKPISAVQLSERAAKGESFSFLDVRSPDAFKNSHIDGAKNIPLEDLEKRKKEVPLSGKIITCDDDPLRSFQAAVRLYDMHIWGVSYLSDSLKTLKEVSSKK